MHLRAHISLHGVDLSRQRWEDCRDGDGDATGERGGRQREAGVGRQVASSSEDEGGGCGVDGGRGVDSSGMGTSDGAGGEIRRRQGHSVIRSCNAQLVGEATQWAHYGQGGGRML